MPCVLLGQDRHGQTPEAPLGPGALRQARRGMRLAAELNLPLVTVIDTAGAALSREAEERGLAGEIARCIADMVALRSAHGLGASRARHRRRSARADARRPRSWPRNTGGSPRFPPRGPARSCTTTPSHAPAMAANKESGRRICSQTASSTASSPNTPTPPRNPKPSALRVGAALRHELAALGNADTANRLTERAERFDRIGQPDPVLAQAG